MPVDPQWSAESDPARIRFGFTFVARATGRSPLRPWDPRRPKRQDSSGLQTIRPGFPRCIAESDPARIRFGFTIVGATGRSPVRRLDPGHPISQDSPGPPTIRPGYPRCIAESDPARIRFGFTIVGATGRVIRDVLPNPIQRGFVSDSHTRATGRSPVRRWDSGRPKGQDSPGLPNTWPGYTRNTAESVTGSRCA